MKKNKFLAYVSTISVVSGVVAINACAAAPVALTDALTTAKGDILDGLSAVAPLAIAVMGAFLVWRYGIKFFKSLAK